MQRGLGAHVWDADGNEYIDLMCSYGPVVLGHRIPGGGGGRPAGGGGRLPERPSSRMVELAEAFTRIVDHADWAIFSKNGTDATTQCLTIARAATGKRKILWPPALPRRRPVVHPNLRGVLPRTVPICSGTASTTWPRWRRPCSWPGTTSRGGGQPDPP